MIDTTPKPLYEEILAAEDLRDRRLRKSKDIIRQYHTATYDGSGELDDPENHAFEYISLIVPQMIFENPLILISGADMNQEIADLQNATNRWSRWTNLRQVGLLLAVDQCISWGVAEIQPQIVPGWVPGEVNKDGSTDVPMMPRVRRIPQNRFFMDPLAIEEDLARYKGILVIADKDALLKRAKNESEGWDRAAINSVPTGNDVNKYRPDSQDLKGLDRGEMCYYEVHIPEEELKDSPGADQGFYGTIRTIAVGGDGGVLEIRKPRPYYGSRHGPYVVFGTYTVPDRAWPMSSLYPVQAQVKDLNNHGRAIRNAAAKHKKIGLGDALQRADAERINNANNGDFLLVQGLDKNKVAEIAMGGVDEAMLVYRNLARDLLDRASGVTDAMRGNVSGDATATENAIAENASSMRVEFVKRQFQDGMRRLLTRVAECLYNDDRYEVPMPNGDVYFGGSGPDMVERVKKRFPGIVLPPGFGMGERTPFEALEVNLDVSSMERQNQAKLQRNVTQMFQLYVTALPMMAQFPDAAPWEEMFASYARAFGDPSLGKVNPQAAREAMMEMAETAGPTGGGGSGVGGQGGGAPNLLKSSGSSGAQSAGGPKMNLERRVANSSNNPKPRAGVSMVK